MIQPVEMKLSLPMSLSGGEKTTTEKVWAILTASHVGDIERVRSLVEEGPGLAYAKYNYTPPIHFAVLEGHEELVRFLLDRGAHDPNYRTYPFLDSLQTMARDRGFETIANLLDGYASDPGRQKYSGDNGEIFYSRTKEEERFQKAVNDNKLKTASSILKEHPEFALDETYFWGEGILSMPANRGDVKMLELLMSYGAKVPPISKWGRFYYFKHYRIAKFLMENGMDANHKTWHHVTLLHDMAQEGDIDKARLLIEHGAGLDPIDEEYHSTPLGMAARWGNGDMVKFLLLQGADSTKSGAPWSTPLAWARSKGHQATEKLLTDAGAA
jgi:hypothetical protein